MLFYQKQSSNPADQLAQVATTDQQDYQTATEKHSGIRPRKVSEVALALYILKGFEEYNVSQQQSNSCVISFWIFFT